MAEVVQAAPMATLAVHWLELDEQWVPSTHSMLLLPAQTPPAATRAVHAVLLSSQKAERTQSVGDLQVAPTASKAVQVCVTMLHPTSVVLEDAQSSSKVQGAPSLWLPGLIPYPYTESQDGFEDETRSVQKVPALTWERTSARQASPAWESYCPPAAAKASSAWQDLPSPGSLAWMQHLAISAQKPSANFSASLSLQPSENAMVRHARTPNDNFMWVPFSTTTSS
jgi:hypothetical protein